MKTLLLSLLLIVVGTMQAQQIDSTAVDTVYHAKNDRIIIYEDDEELIQRKKGEYEVDGKYITFWLYRVNQIENGLPEYVYNIIEIIKKYEIENLDIKKWLSYGYTKEEYIYNTQNNTFSNRIQIFYTQNGHSIYIIERDIKWDVPIPGTITNIICKHAKALHAARTNR